jgi:hypothetical protein
MNQQYQETLTNTDPVKAAILSNLNCQEIDMTKQLKTFSAMTAVLLACGLSSPAGAEPNLPGGDNVPFSTQAPIYEAAQPIRLAGPTSAAAQRADERQMAGFAMNGNGAADLFHWQALQKTSQTYGE